MIGFLLHSEGELLEEVKTVMTPVQALMIKAMNTSIRDYEKLMRDINLIIETQHIECFTSDQKK